jgi:hypothetical protein
MNYNEVSLANFSDLASRVDTLDITMNSFTVILILSGWVSDGGTGYKNEVMVSSLTGNEILTAVLYNDGTATEEQLRIFDTCITNIETVAGKVIFYCSELPTVTFSVILKGKMAAPPEVVVNLSQVMTTLDTINTNLNGVYFDHYDENSVYHADELYAHWVI